MAYLLRLALGDLKLMVVEVVTISSIISLAAGVRALTNVVEGFRDVGFHTLWDYLITVVYGELRLITYLWAAPIWVLFLISTYLTSSYLLNDLIPTCKVLTCLGASKYFVVKLLVLRYLLISLLSWLIGWSAGLTASQMFFRFTAYFLKAPYEIPYLNLRDLVELALTSHSLILLGITPTVIKIVRRSF